MRHFVYLDTDTLNSYLSQINEGLLKSTVNETVDEIATTKNDEIMPGKNKFESEFGFKPILNLKFTEDKDVMNTTNTLSQIETGRELIEKILHDNSLEQFIKYLKNDNLIVSIDSSRLGDYIEIKEKFRVRDLDYLLGLYSDELIEFFMNNSKVELENLIESMKNNNNISTKTIRKQGEEKLKKERENYLQIRKIINIAKEIMPFSKYIVCDNCVIPLEEKYLRITTNKSRFSYSGELNIIGRYTGDLKDAFARESEIKNEYDDVLKSIDEVLKVLYKDTLGLNESMKIIVPIALYFE